MTHGTIMIHATPEELAAIIDAAMRVGMLCGEALCEKAGSFTCDEAEAVEALLVATGSDYVDDFRLMHADGDDEPEDRHHGGW